MTWDDWTALPHCQSFDIASSLLGDRIDHGASRTVFACALDPERFVVKVNRGDSQSNALEWRVWQDLKDAKLGKWLAPCVYLSVNGQVLVQRRTTPVGIKKMPARVPHFFTDLKVQNWGRMDGRIVCHDYDVIVRDYGRRMNKARWWAE